MMTNIIVQKFGGTSVGSSERLSQVANIIKKSSQTNPIIAVISALSPERKANGTTSLLLKATNNALKAESFEEELSIIITNHHEAVTGAIKDSKLKEETLDFVNNEITRIKTFLTALSVIRECSPSSMDSVICAGERLSAFVLSRTLISIGVNAEYIDLSDVINWPVDSVSSAFFDEVQASIAKRCTPKQIQPNSYSVPVVTGYFGPVPGGMLEHVGRGYTDFTAAMITAGLGREQVSELQVWKEVDGICTADPRRVKDAQLLPEISALEASELTHFGSEVLHPFTVERVTEHSIPIRVKNTFNPSNLGTCVLPSTTSQTSQISAITVKAGITVVTLTSNRMFNTYGFLAKTFDILRNGGIVVDIVATSEISISFSVEKEANIKLVKPQLEELGKVIVESNMAILAVVGQNIQTSVGTAGKLFSTLAEANIDVGMISKGASRVNISCIIAEKDIDRALPEVHKAFF